VPGARSFVVITGPDPVICLTVEKEMAGSSPAMTQSWIVIA
jgi:hypothetical protein